MASASTIMIMMAAVAGVRAKFGLAMKEERALRLVSHRSPADFYRSSKPCGRRKKTNRLHLSRKAKVARRRAA